MPVSIPDQRTPRDVYAFGVTSFLNDTASEMAYWILPAFIASLGAGPAKLGIIEGLAESVASFAKLFSGYLADHVSRRKPIVVGGYVVANAVKPLLALVSSWWQILGIRFADRFAKGMRGTARDVMVADSVDKSNIGSAYGLIQAMDSAGAIAGPLLALALIGHFGMRGVFAWAAVPGALCILVAWLGIREIRRGGSQFPVPSSQTSVASSHCRSPVLRPPARRLRNWLQLGVRAFACRLVITTCWPWSLCFRSAIRATCSSCCGRVTLGFQPRTRHCWGWCST